MIEYVNWKCPFTLKNGKECGKLHIVAWDTDYDSPCDGESLLCLRHEKYDTECGVQYDSKRSRQSKVW